MIRLSLQKVRFESFSILMSKTSGFLLDVVMPAFCVTNESLMIFKNLGP